jgi:hypothetical protein
MLIDSRSRFANAAEFFGAAATAKIGQAIDLIAAPTDLGEGNPLHWVVQLGAAVTGGTSVEFQLVTADNAALSSNPVVLVSSGAVAVADLTLNRRVLAVQLPKANYKRYLGLRVVRVGTSTTGTVTSFITDHAPSWRAYPEGMN